MRHRTGTTKKGCHVAEYHPVARRVGPSVKTSGRSVHIVIHRPQAAAWARFRTNASVLPVAQIGHKQADVARSATVDREVQTSLVTTGTAAN